MTVTDWQAKEAGAIAERGIGRPVATPLDRPGFARRTAIEFLVPLFDIVAVAVVLTMIDRTSTEIALAITLPVVLGATMPLGRRLNYGLFNDLPRIAGSVAGSLLGVGLLATRWDDGVPVGTAVWFLLGICVARFLSYFCIRSLRRTRSRRANTAIIGSGELGCEVFRVLTQHPELGLEPIGFIDDVPPRDDHPLLGSYGDLSTVVEEHGITRVIVAYGANRRAHELISTLRTATTLDLEVYVIPRFFELGLAPTGPQIEQLWGIPAYRVRRSAQRARASWWLKRTFDILFSATALILLSPLLAIIALAVRLSGKGPILFRQHRIGQHGRPIHLLKFRSLKVNGDSDTTWSVSDDPRQTKVGSILRKLSLDELPQFWNILRGDMSVVGPRPERPLFVDRFSEEIHGYSDRHRLPVGLTGLAQVHGLRGDTSIAERARFDNAYIEHWSLWQDLIIMVRTAAAVARDAVHGFAGGGRPHDPIDDVEQVLDIAASEDPSSH